MNTPIEACNTTYGNFHKDVSKKYKIPTLQRPYTWDLNEVEKLWDDLVENESSYYIGSMVIIRNGGTVSLDQIIDGQQRLITLALFLIAIRDYVNEKKRSGFNTINKEISIILSGTEDKVKFIRLNFTNENSNDVYSSMVNSILVEKNDKETQNRFINNLDAIKDKLALFAPNGEPQKISKLIEKIKSIQIIYITCHDMAAAYKLFESINATAVTLATTDLIKNSIFGSFSKNIKQLEIVEKEWDCMYERFNERSNFLKTYIRHHWISQVGYTSHSKLFSDFLKKYKKESDLLLYLNSLFENSSTYLSLRDSKVDSLSKLSKIRNTRNEIREILEFLSFLGVDQVYSVLLFIYNKDSKNFKKDLIRLTAFQFLYKYIPGSPSVPEKKYFANYCSGKITRDKVFAGLFDLCKNQKPQFIKAITEKMKYIESKSGDVQFILERYIYSKENTIKFKNPTIEHIIPQDEKDDIYKKFSCGKKDIYKLVNNIGNLTILEKGENSSKGKYNKPFSEKYPIYLQNIFSVNKEISNYNFSNNPEDAIKSRNSDISGDLYTIFIKALKTGKWN